MLMKRVREGGQENEAATEAVRGGVGSSGVREGIEPPPRHQNAGRHRGMIEAELRPVFVGRLFPLGQVTMTAGVCARVAENAEFAKHVTQGVQRHASGDWGSVDDADRRENELSLQQGARLLSAYGEGDGKIWIITEADRSLTTILFPSEY